MRMKIYKSVRFLIVSIAILSCIGFMNTLAEAASAPLHSHYLIDNEFRYLALGVYEDHLLLSDYTPPIYVQLTHDKIESELPTNSESRLLPQFEDYMGLIASALSDLFNIDTMQDIIQSGVGELWNKLRPYVVIAGVIVVGVIIVTIKISRRIFKYLFAGGFLLLIVYALTQMTN